MNDRLTREMQNSDALFDAATKVLVALDACRRDLAEERARTGRLTEAFEEKARDAASQAANCASELDFDTAAYFRGKAWAFREAAEHWAGTEQPA